MKKLGYTARWFISCQSRCSGRIQSRAVFVLLWFFRMMSAIIMRRRSRIAPLTSKIEKKRKQPTHFFLRKAKGLAKPSMVLAEQLDTCDKICVIRYIGWVSKGQMRGIDEAVRIQLGYYIPEQAEQKKTGQMPKGRRRRRWINWLQGRKQPVYWESASKTLDAARTDGLISYVQYVENGCWCSQHRLGWQRWLTIHQKWRTWLCWQ